MLRIIAKKLLLLTFALLAAWQITSFLAPGDDQALEISLACALLVACIVGNINMMPSGHGDGRFWCLLGFPVKLLVFYVPLFGFATLAMYLPENPQLLSAVPRIQSLGSSIFVVWVLLVFDWYMISGPAIAHIPREDIPEYQLDEVSNAIQRVRRGSIRPD